MEIVTVLLSEDFRYHEAFGEGHFDSLLGVSDLNAGCSLSHCWSLVNDPRVLGYISANNSSDLL